MPSPTHKQVHRLMHRQMQQLQCAIQSHIAIRISYWEPGDGSVDQSIVPKHEDQN